MRIRRSTLPPQPPPPQQQPQPPSHTPSPSPSPCFSSSSSSHSTISTTHSPTSSTTSSSSSSSSSSPSPSLSLPSNGRCHGLDLLVKAVHYVAGSIIGVPYIQRRIIRRRKPALSFTHFIINSPHHHHHHHDVVDVDVDVDVVLQQHALKISKQKRRSKGVTSFKYPSKRKRSIKA